MKALAFILTLLMVLPLGLCGCNRTGRREATTPAVTKSGTDEITATIEATDTSAETVTETEANTTATPATTVAPVTTVTPGTTEAPKTTETSETTEAPGTTAQALRELYYKDEDGYIRIRGSENIRLPAEGLYIEFKENDTVNYFASNELVVSSGSAVVPAIYTADGRKITNSPHDLVETNGQYYLSFSSGEKLSLLPAGYIDAETGNYIEFNGEFIPAYISERLSYVHLTNRGSDCAYIIKTSDGGKTFTIGSILLYHLYIAGVSFINENVGYVLISGGFAAGSVVSSLYKTTDGGETFSEIKGFTGYHFNGILFLNENAGFLASETSRPIYLTAEEGTGWKSFGNSGIPIDNDITGMPRVYYIVIFQMLLPYFDGDYGVWPMQINYEDGDKKYFYYISTDGGVSWVLFDPELPDEEADIFFFEIKGVL